MGTWGMGGKYEEDESNIEESIEALKFGLQLGYRLIDTAELYGQGLTEKIVAQAIKDYKREEIFLVSKVWKTNLNFENLVQSAQKSLERLETNYLDLYLVHWPNEGVSLFETMSGLEYLIKEGKVRNIGVSNFSVALLEEAQRYLKITKLFANQIEFNLANRQAEKCVIPYCQSRGINLIAYCPLLKGNLNWQEAPVFAKLSEKYQKTSIQIVLNWIISQGLTPIPKASRSEHLKENFGAIGWKLAAEDIDLINKTQF